MRPNIKGTALIAFLLLDKLTKHVANKINEMNEKMEATKKIFDRFLSAQEEPQLPMILQKQFSLQKVEYHIISSHKVNKDDTAYLYHHLWSGYVM